ncbi:uncharacterized protein E5676_scaffold2256G00130 [Cucumis melo var. makuwa]|uniref:Uncharacterized protein n=1 Tax=Cucumis melo var. makuwa TaxID=1194695 RepID=A0A5D3DRT0_CUCMM|nr:uncharacterized protein E5676_scaffold2256G00130 [Cucumis melo var. makuwa]
MQHQTSGKTFNERQKFPFSRRFLGDFLTPHHYVEKSPLNRFSSVIYRTETEREKEKRSRERRRHFRHPSIAVPPSSIAALPRRCPLPPSATLGWSTKRYQACPICMGDRSSFGIRGRISFMGHRRYLPQNHVWRRSRIHDGKVERKAPPVVMNGHEILKQLDQLESPVMSKHPSIHDKKRKRALNWTKKSIFFDLPYWSRLLLRYKLDVMHIEKNVCDNLVGTLLNIKGKTKDTTNARLDLQDLKIRKDLHLVEVGNRLVKPHASYTLSTSERVEFFWFRMKRLTVWLELEKLLFGRVKQVPGSGEGGWNPSARIRKIIIENSTSFLNRNDQSGTIVYLGLTSSPSSFLNSNECTSELGSCVNFGEQLTSQLAHGRSKLLSKQWFATTQQFPFDRNSHIFSNRNLVEDGITDGGENVVGREKAREEEVGDEKWISNLQQRGKGSEYRKLKWGKFVEGFAGKV